MISMGPSTSKAMIVEGMTVSAEAKEPSADGVIAAVLEAKSQE